MNHPIRLKPVLAVVAFAFVLIAADAVQAARSLQPAYHPAAAAHMKAAIRLMAIAGCKPCHVRRKLGVVAHRHLFLAQRFTQNPGARAELSAAMATLGQLTQTPGVPLFDPAIQRTQLAMQLECNPAYNSPVLAQPGYPNAPLQPTPAGPTPGQVAPSVQPPAAPLVLPQPAPSAIPRPSASGPQEF